MAKHKYYIRKSPNSPANEADWLELSGKEFYALVNSPEGENRHFANMGEFTIEMPADKYASWSRDRKRSAYLNDLEDGVTILALYGDQQSESGSIEEHIPDPSVDVEHDVISGIEREKLRAAVQTLDAESRYIIDALFLSDNAKTERDLAKELGVSQPIIHRRKKKFWKN